MDKQLYPGYWLIDHRSFGRHKAVYRIPVLSAGWQESEDKMTGNRYFFLVHREDERKVAWMIGNQEKDPVAYLQFRTPEFYGARPDSQTEIVFQLPVEKFEAESYQKVFNKFPLFAPDDDCPVTVVATKKISIDSGGLPLDDRPCEVVFRALVVRDRKLVPFQTDYEPVIQAHVNIH